MSSGGDHGHGRSCQALRRRCLASQAVAIQLNAVGGVKDAVQDGVAEGRIPDDAVPGGHGDLAGDQQGAPIVAVVDDFQQIAPLIRVQRLWAPVVVAERTGQPTFARAGRPRDGEVLVLANPVAGGERLEQRAVQATGGTQVDVLDDRGLAQLAGVQMARQTPVVARCGESSGLTKATR